jgi:hypothetical protein
MDEEENEAASPTPKTPPLLFRDKLQRLQPFLPLLLSDVRLHEC